MTDQLDLFEELVVRLEERIMRDFERRGGWPPRIF